MSERPLSPHLNIIKWKFSMTYSILHRVTGLALCVGILLIPLGLLAMLFGQNVFNFFRYLLLSPIGMLCLLGWTWSFFYHFGGGIRHLFWDMGKGYSLKTAQFTGHLNFIVSILLTALVVIMAISIYMVGE